VVSDGSFTEGIGTAARILFEKNILDEGKSTTKKYKEQRKYNQHTEVN